MGASPHLPHTEGVCSLYILPLPYPAGLPGYRPPGGGGSGLQLLQQGCTQILPKPSHPRE